MFHYSKDQDNIVTITMDMQGRSANVINAEFGNLIVDTLNKLEAEKDNIDGVVLTSAKSTFFAGADIDNLYKQTDAKEIFDMCEGLKAQFRRLEKLGKPVVAALNGAALGGGLELALVCHYRVALNNPKAQFGLPEVGLGLLPGGGGIIRLTRMIGLQPALPLLTEGKRLKVKDALSNGLINEIAESPEDMIAKAKAWIKANPKAINPWDDKGFKFPGGDAKNPKVASMIPIVPAMTKKKTHGNYPAVQAIINTAVEGSVVDFDTACRIESRYFTSLATGQVSKNMITAFWYNLNAINAGNSRPKGFEKYTTKKVGVLGAGMMGAGIAYVSAYAGMEVVLKDVSIESAEKGKAYSEGILKKLISKGKVSKEKAEEILSRIKATDKPEFDGCDLIIEAVFEDRNLKAKVTQEAEATMLTEGTFASNTSTLPITGLATASTRPKQFIGLHFFSPVDKMPLVEIICGKETDDATLAKAFDYVLQIKKTPIVVNDSRGFYTSRVFSTYVMEGIALLAEGEHPRSIENAGLKAGMPVGPLALTDEVSLKLMDHIRQQTEKDLIAEGKEIPKHPGLPVISKMLELNRPGKAAGAGFYEYPKDGKKHLWEGLRQQFPLKEQLSEHEMVERLLFVQAIDTVRCVEENVLRSVADANIGSIFGWGFSPFNGGTLQFINGYGLDKFVKRAAEYEAKYGERFAVPQLLKDKAAKGEIFVD
ncbi:MAG: enoyl-CoA hydratase/isomerase family protein [Chitinophagales bacterium]|nr:enoyl-CoA hydratase/isomerase family protein [Chitinophagales bacterium]HMU98376.1 3-hydroxyacyl-CoA dehydrogenase NAD-binding domain-containing protein [Chitinophagales bacterium]HMV03395.1 3-hydroxyacyl-CoA dehydrogenase NAD-binding domain-containing protein [Chitinophagales bacterium]HMZ68931.1 3-hydroxyacyl-CoA dehydrogenase NAD-binding domain-containing protein [Chitinophagales bacterium]HMZ93589.1 3-hydroxyacyl-CoA dehydrogenase NAD-binding domain-containing protein [Chitinophagales ba